MKHPPTTSHNYLPRLLALTAVLPPKSSHTADIRHDDWCDVLRGGFCNCEPDITLRDGIQPPLEPR